MSAAAAGGESKEGEAKAQAATRLDVLEPIQSFVRLKPLSAEPGGGGTGHEAKHTVGEWDDTRVCVNLPGTGKARAFSHMRGVAGPEASQQRFYESTAQAAVRRFLDGHDVDVLMYGQTGSGKTYTCFGPPGSTAETAEAAATSGATTASELCREEHGLFPRAAFEAVEAVERVNNLKGKGGGRALLYGAMVEMWIGSFSMQNALDLLNGRQMCFVDREHHLQGAKQVPLRTGADVVKLAAAVELRMTKATRMNASSSRSHCVTVLSLYSLDGEDGVRESRLQFFDLMGK